MKQVYWPNFIESPTVSRKNRSSEVRSFNICLTHSYFCPVSLTLHRIKKKTSEQGVWDREIKLRWSCMPCYGLGFEVNFLQSFFRLWRQFTFYRDVEWHRGVVLSFLWFKLHCSSILIMLFLHLFASTEKVSKVCMETEPFSTSLRVQRQNTDQRLVRCRLWGRCGRTCLIFVCRFGFFL